MKKLIFAFCFVLGGIVAVNAQDSTSTTQEKKDQYSNRAGTEDQDREKINSRDLPDAVKRSLEGQEYRGWLVNAAYKTKGVASSTTDDQSAKDSSDTTKVSGNNSGAYAQEAFVVELKNGAQTKTVRFDKDGKKLDDPGLKTNDQN